MSKYKIFFLHGWLFDSRIWFGLDELLSNQHQSILIDLPGYGKNKEKKEKPVKYCREIFSGLSSPSVVVGWSYGGILALLGLPRYYQSIEKIILINSHPILVSKNRLANNINLDNIENLKHNLVLDRKKTVKNFFFECVRGSPKEVSDYKYLIKKFKLSSLPNNATLLRGLSNISNINCFDDLKNTQKKILIIHSKKDNLLGERFFSEFKKNKNIKFCLFDEVPHIPFISYKKEICSVMRKFIEE